MGRPLININKDDFENLCRLQCTLVEISDWFKCSEDTIERWCKRMYGKTFADIYKKYSSSGKISLRRAQFRLAEKFPAMAIWLGKQYLNQADIPQVEEETVRDIRIKFEDGSENGSSDDL